MAYKGDTHNYMRAKIEVIDFYKAEINERGYLKILFPYSFQYN